MSIFSKHQCHTLIAYSCLDSSFPSEPITNYKLSLHKFIKIMSAKINNIFILGTTGGIGEALACRFHGLGKKVIATGRRRDNLGPLDSKNT